MNAVVPSIATPTSRHDWPWLTARLHLPKPLAGTAGLPTLRLDHGRVLADVPLEQVVPSMCSKHRLALGLDWGESRLLTGALLRLEVHAGQLVITTNGRFLEADVRGLQEHYHLVRRNHEQVRTKLIHLQRLEDGQVKRGRAPDPQRQA